MDIIDIEVKKRPSLKYKFKDLKVYGSTEWLAGGKKKYRRVFEKEQVGYLYVELSCFNKMFDENEWNAKIKLVCSRFLDNGKEQLCAINVDRHITSDENVFFVREGWGHSKPGQYWKAGSYIWEAYVAEVVPVEAEMANSTEKPEKTKVKTPTEKVDKNKENIKEKDSEEGKSNLEIVEEKTLDYTLAGSLPSTLKMLAQ